MNRIEKITMPVGDLARALGVTVVQPDQHARQYIVTKDDARELANSRTLRATVCKVGGDPIEE